MMELPLITGIELCNHVVDIELLEKPLIIVSQCCVELSHRLDQLLDGGAEVQILDDRKLFGSLLEHN